MDEDEDVEGDVPAKHLQLQSSLHLRWWAGIIVPGVMCFCMAFRSCFSNFSMFSATNQVLLLSLEAGWARARQQVSNEASAFCCPG